MNRSIAGIVLLGLVVAASGCRCDGGLFAPDEELRVSGPNGEVGDELLVDFGEVRAGSSAERNLSITNAGRTELRLDALTHLDGEPVAGAGAAPDDGVFGVRLEGSVEVAAGESRSLTVSLRAARTGALDEPTELRSRFAIRTVAGTEVKVTLLARVVPDECDLPEEIDFGNRWAGAAAEVTLEFPSASRLEDTTVEVSEVRNLVVPAFNRIGPQAQRVNAGDIAQVVFRFHPPAATDYVAEVDIRRSERCSARTVRLRGRGITEALIVTPRPVDCGYVPPGLTGRARVTVTNIGPEDVVLVPEPGTSSVFVWEEPSAQALVLAADSVELEVLCTPDSEGPLTGSLTLSTSLSRQPSLQVDAKVYGGGPDIAAEPAAIDFGRVGFLASANPPVVQRRQLRIRNQGTAVPEVAGHLFLGEPYLEIEPGEGTSAGEFRALLRSEYDPGQGLAPASLGGAELRIEVELQPESTGPKRARLLIRSNDLDEPVLVVPLQGEAVHATPCAYSLEPRLLELGTHLHPATSVGTARFRNESSVGAVPCFVSVLGVEPYDSEFEYSGPPSLELLPGEYTDLEVRFVPQPRPHGQFEEVTGALLLSVSSDGDSAPTVGLRANAAVPCLFIVPERLDFGGVALGCASAPVEVSIFNSCTDQQVLLLPPGVAGCAPGSTCAPFGVTATGISDGGLLLAPSDSPATVQVTFSPQVTGAAGGTLTLPTSQHDAGVAYNLPLTGDGVQSTLREDVFEQAASPRLDIVMLYHPHYDFQSDFNGYDTQIPVLADFLLASPIDFRVGVTYGGDWTVAEYYYDAPPYPPGVEGGFLLGDPAAEPWLDRNTPNLKQKLMSRFARLPSGQGLDPGIQAAGLGFAHFNALLAALSPPATHYTNAGFRRADAGFLGLVVSDGAADHSTYPGVLGPSCSRIKPLAHVLSQLRAAAGIHEVTISTSLWGGLAPGPGNCFTTPEGLTRSDLMAMQTGGTLVRSLFSGSDSWGAAFEESIYRAAKLRWRFPLSAVPDFSQGPVEVLINGTPMPAAEASGEVNWTYDASANEVLFGLSKMPPPGSQVTLRYHQQCH